MKLREILVDPVAGKLSASRLLAILWGVAAIAAMFLVDDPIVIGEAFGGSLTALGLRKKAEAPR